MKVDDGLAAVAKAAQVLGSLAERDAPIGKRTTYRVGGNAALFVSVESEDELARVCLAVQQSGVDVLILGNGSNVLVADEGFPGLCITLGDRFASLEIEPDENIIWAGGALPYPVLARRLGAAGLAGMSWAVGIPGSVGGAVRMNAGGHGAETAQHLLSAVVVDLCTGESRHYSNEEFEFGYRSSCLRATQLVSKASFSVKRGDRAQLDAEIDAVVAWRRENQPGGRNGGSVFSNPPEDSAGRLIDEAGLRGTRIGSAEVSKKHANFILVDSDGSADDVERLIEFVREQVRRKANIDLALELRLIGFAQ